MRRFRHHAIAVLVLALAGSGPSAEASTPETSALEPVATSARAADGANGEVGVGIWHRLSFDRSHSGPENERLVCVPVRKDVVMSCHYDKVPAPELNFYWNSEEGFFQGADVTDGWSCPGWFPASTCASVARVVQGQFVFVNPGVHAPFFVDTALVFTGSGPDARMYFYWIDQFVCPWFRTFDQALAANPIPLPFDGTWGANDCVRAP